MSTPYASKEGLQGTSSQISTRLKWTAFNILVIQNASAAVLMKAAQLDSGSGGLNTQCSVMVQEFLKGAMCVALLLAQGDMKSAFSNWRELIKTSVPSLLYLVQNNLQYVASANLDSATYAVLYQMKLLTTAILSVLILGKKLLRLQWAALLLLVCGVACVTTSAITQNHSSAEARGRMMYGVLTVFMATLLSGLAGVYAEKILKDSSVSLWARNLQMAICSAMVGMGTLMFSNGGQVLQNGFFHGFTISAWISCINNALGGLLVAVVVKYMDQIMKNFATSFAILVTAGMSVMMFGTQISLQFSLGTSLVIYSFLLYDTSLSERMIKCIWRAPKVGEDSRAPNQCIEIRANAHHSG